MNSEPVMFATLALVVWTADGFWVWRLLTHGQSPGLFEHREQLAVIYGFLRMILDVVMLGLILVMSDLFFDRSASLDRNIGRAAVVLTLFGLSFGNWWLVMRLLTWRSTILISSLRMLVGSALWSCCVFAIPFMMLFFQDEVRHMLALVRGSG